MRSLIFVFAFTFAAAACDRAPQHQSTVPDSTTRLAAQDTVAYAQATFDPAAFDTIRWVDDSAHFARGADVYRWACATCHGPTGKGDGGAVFNGDTIHPPSFVNPEWRFAKDEMGLRKRIFVGNARGMPHWGLRGTQPGDIMAVEKYILFKLRKQS